MISFKRYPLLESWFFYLKGINKKRDFKTGDKFYYVRFYYFEMEKTKKL